MDKGVRVAVDIAAKTLEVLCSVDGKTPESRSFPNDEQGHRALGRWIVRRGKTTQLILEATGVYWLDLAIGLSGKISVMVVNPRTMRRFAEVLHEEHKTDMIDAAVMLEYLKRMEFRAWVPPRREELDLRCISRRMRKLRDQITAEKNRLHAGDSTEATPEIVLESCQRTIEWLEQEFALLEKSAAELIENDERLSQACACLTSVKGIGQRSAIYLLGELFVLPADLDARQWVSLAGLFPRQAISGSSIRKTTTIGKRGNSYLRAALFMPALSASSHIPAYKNHVERLRQRGLTPKQGTVAIMRRMLHLIHALIDNDQLFDEKRLEPKEKAAEAA